MASAEVREFFRVLRSGDRPSVDALLRQLDAPLRKVIRMRLIDGRLRRTVDTTDIFHSLIKDFLSQKVGEASPSKLSTGVRAYLAAAVHHKIQTKARKERRHAGSLPTDPEPADSHQPAAEQVDAKDYLEAVRRRMSDGTRLLWDLSLQGLTWMEISEKVGGRPDTLRMQLRRGLAKVLAELANKESSHAG